MWRCADILRLVVLSWYCRIKSRDQDLLVVVFDSKVGP